MIELIGEVLTVTRNGRRIVIQPLTARDSVQALRTMGYGEAVSLVFGNGAERDRVVGLGKRKGLLR